MVLNTIAWRYTQSINNIKTIFASQNLPYSVECFKCSCGNQFTRLYHLVDEIEAYICPNCDNEIFYDASLYLSNGVWYDPIENHFSAEQLIKSCSYGLLWDEDAGELTIYININIPNDIDLASNKLIYTQKKLYEICIHEHGHINEEIFVNFNLDSLSKDNEYYRGDQISTNELINSHHVLSTFKKNTMNYIIANDYFSHIAKIRNECQSLEMLVYFLQYSNFKHTGFYKWDNLMLFPHNIDFTIDNALEYTLHGRKEKTLKKAVFSNYSEQMTKYGRYNFIFVNAICRYIGDTNIAIRMLKLDFNKHLNMFVNHSNLLIFIEYISNNYSYKQIEKLFIGYANQDTFWLLDTLELFMAISYEGVIGNYQSPTTCHYRQIHDSLYTYHQIVFGQKLINMVFDYDVKQTHLCRKLEQYDVRLPRNGLELYNWSVALGNCLSSYGNMILHKVSIVYGFFEDDEIKFAVEIRKNEIIQARYKYNIGLNSKDNHIVKSWLEFITQPPYNLKISQ